MTEENKEQEPLGENVSPERDADFSTLDAPGAGPADGVHGASNEEITRLNNELAEANEKYLRALAELENYKKRALKERSELLKYQGEPVFVDLLRVQDHLDLALQHSESDPAKVREGVELINKMLRDVLAKWEVRANSALGKEFDPQSHFALSKVWVDDAKPGTVISEPKKAYYYKDRLIRPGEAVVASDERPKGEEGDQ